MYQCLIDMQFNHIPCSAVLVSSFDIALNIPVAWCAGMLSLLFYLTLENKIFVC